MKYRYIEPSDFPFQYSQKELNLFREAGVLDQARDPSNSPHYMYISELPFRMMISECSGGVLDSVRRCCVAINSGVDRLTEQWDSLIDFDSTISIVYKIVGGNALFCRIVELRDGSGYELSTDDKKTLYVGECLETATLLKDRWVSGTS